MEATPIGPTPENFLENAGQIAERWNLSPLLSAELQRMAEEATGGLTEFYGTAEGLSAEGARLSALTANQNLALFGGALRAFAFLEERHELVVDEGLVAEFRLGLCPGFHPIC